MTECQICARTIKCNEKGIVAHHGYKRPGNGWQTKSCSGAREPNYALSASAIPKEILIVSIWVSQRKMYLRQVKAGNIAVPSIMSRGQPVQPGDPLYSIRQKEYISRIEWDIKQGEREEDRLRKRYVDWKPSK